MKNIFKIIPYSLLLLVFGCQNEDGVNEGKFNPNPESGWVEFTRTQTTAGQSASTVSVPVKINVPVYQDGLNIAYSFQAAEGDYTQYVTSSGGTVFADPDDYSIDNNRIVTISIPLVNLESPRDFVTSFDVVLTSVDAGAVGIGVDEDSIVVHRVIIPCSNPDVLPTDYFVGDYVLADVDGTIGPGNGTENFGSGVVTLTVDPFNPNARLFSAGILPAFNPEIELISIEFSTDDNTVILGNVDPSLACGAGAPPYIYVSAGAANRTEWDICNDQFITINYTEDPNGSCGGPYVSSFSLTAN